MWERFLASAEKRRMTPRFKGDLPEPQWNYTTAKWIFAATKLEQEGKRRKTTPQLT
jgi:hypothetical protein